ncbi:hypothetical protein [Aquihabitans sp. McL0605]|uniref:hypothetical protein n=1 Tax=Aquihabitans sp. McL0605 TaxID=3415671 RepID=UPI003CF4ABDD
MSDDEPPDDAPPGGPWTPPPGPPPAGPAGPPAGPPGWPPAPGPASPPPAGPPPGQPGGYQPPAAPPGYGPPPPAYGPPGSGYAPSGYGWYPPQQQEHPQGSTVLVLGILSFACCQILGPVAWIMGNHAIKEIDARPGYYSNRGPVQAGRILGMVSTALLVLVILFYGVIIAVTFLGASTSG